MRNEMREIDLKQRTKQFALRIIAMHDALRGDDVLRTIGRQLLRSGTSVGAQYREADRARSTAEFISKLESALQELEETEYWIELLVESGRVVPSRAAELLAETDQLVRIFVASINTAKARRRAEKAAKPRKVV